VNVIVLFARTVVLTLGQLTKHRPSVNGQRLVTIFGHKYVCVVAFAGAKLIRNNASHVCTTASCLRRLYARVCCCLDHACMHSIYTSVRMGFYLNRSFSKIIWYVFSRKRSVEGLFKTSPGFC